VLLFAVVLSIVSGLFFGLYPAWDGARASAAATLRDDRASPPGRAARRGFAARWCVPR